MSTSAPLFADQPEMLRARPSALREVTGFVLTLLVITLLPGPSFGQSNVSYFNFDASGNLTSIQPTGPSAPGIFAQPRSLLLRPGRIGGFSVVAAGAPPLAYQWRFGGQAIPGATTDSIVFSLASTEHLGWYSVSVSNAAGVVLSEEAFLSFDLDGDGLPDVWETRYLGTTSLTATDDFDRDGVSNLDEFLDETNPADDRSVFPRLRVRTYQGTVTVNPNLPKYALDQAVILRAIPDAGRSFLGWSGDLSGMSNPALVVMNRSKTVSAICGLPLGQSLEAPESVWSPGGDAGWFGQINTTHDGVDAAQSGPIGRGEQSWMETTRVFGGIAKMTFWCKLTGDSNDVLRVLINGVEQGAAAIGTNGWQQRNYFLPGGTNQIRWVFVRPGLKDTNSINFINGAWVDQVAFQEVCNVPLAEALDATSSVWLTDGRVGWCGQSAFNHDGTDAAQSAPLVADNQSWLETTNVLTVDGILAFWWQVRSSARVDALRLLVNGVEQAIVEGNSDWEKRTVYLSRGTNVLRWVYNSGPGVDGALASTGDGAWIDQVTMTAYPNPNADLDGDGMADLAAFIFRGRSGDGHDDNTALDAVLNGVVPPLGPFVGGSGDGHDSISFNDFRPDGMSLVMDVFVGGRGDGYDSRVLENFSIDGSALAVFVFFGGRGDGFGSSGVAEFQADGMFLLTDAFRGGAGDGFDEFIVQDFAIDGTAVTIQAFLGSVGDGFSESIAYDLTINGFALAPLVFVGGFGDGFDRSFVTNVRVAAVLWWTNFPTVLWPAAADIYFGTQLSAAQLNAMADVSGNFSYTPPIGTLLQAGSNQPLTVLFLPNDPLNYYPVRLTNRLNVVELRLASVKLLQASHLRITLVCGTNSIIQASTNLVNWVSVQTNLAAEPLTVEYHDFELNTFQQRFYRVVLP